MLVQEISSPLLLDRVRYGAYYEVWHDLGVNPSSALLGVFTGAQQQLVGFTGPLHEDEKRRVGEICRKRGIIVPTN